MCGIAGFANYKYNKEVNIKAMMDRMFHRGPDFGQIKVFEDVNLVFGHRRLSIIDTSVNGIQPMTSHDGRYTIVFNGEIYNHDKIKAMLPNSINYRSTSDTEVLLEAIAHFGFQEAISLCKGMFAIALYDSKEKLLYLTRDRIGEKPLYYGFVGDAFVFASDIASISVLEGFKKNINQRVLGLYFRYGYIPAPYSIYEDIYKLEPGKILKLSFPFNSKEHCELSDYFNMKEVAKKGQNNKFAGNYDEAVEILDYLLKESIKGQMCADVPLGAFLSAGIDSSTTVALMQSLSMNKVKSFTIGMEDKRFNEADAAKDIAKHLGTEHTELYITEREAKDVIPKLSYIFSEPFADSSQIPTYLVSKMTREHVTVSLSGDGGDELFCGYTDYESVPRAYGKVKKIPYPLRKLVSSVILNTGIKNVNSMGIRASLLKADSIKDMYNLSINCDPLVDRIAREKDVLICSNEAIERDYIGEARHDIMLMDMLQYHPDDILVKVDRCAMAVSLETRVPMLDKDVVEFAWSLPVEYLYNETTKEGKRILRDVLYRYVPKEMMDRPKKGFGIPIADWLKNDSELRSYANELMNKNLIEKQGYLNYEVVNRIWTDFIDKGIWRNQIWYILMFQSWLMDNK